MEQFETQHPVHFCVLSENLCHKLEEYATTSASDPPLPRGFGKIRVLYKRLFPRTPKTHVVTFSVINFCKRLYQLPSGFLKVILSSSIKRNLLRKSRRKKG